MFNRHVRSWPIATILMAGCLIGPIHAERSVHAAPPKDRHGVADVPKTGASDSSNAALAIFTRRILPILKQGATSTCAECHLAGVDLKEYIGPNQESTFAGLRARGLIDVDHPDQSKILQFLQKKPDRANPLIDRVRTHDYVAFRSWIRAAVRDPALAKLTDSRIRLGPSMPLEVIRHARVDQVVASFVDNVWTEIARCSGCHSPDQNAAQVKKFGKRVSWIVPRAPEATMRYMLRAKLIDLKQPERSLLLLKPTAQVEHQGGQKFTIGDRTYKQFRKFIVDYSNTVAGKYKTASELPKIDPELGVATSMTNGIWLKIINVPARYDGKLLQVDVYRRQGTGWSHDRWATADRTVFGKGRLWQQSLTLTAPRRSPRAQEILTTPRLPSGDYLVKIYVDENAKLKHDLRASLGADEFIGTRMVTTKWPTGYNRMTVVDFPKSSE